MPKVIIWRDGAIETEFDPGHREWRMGRSETNDITLLDPRKSVSRFHAELREENGRWVFIDLNSQNGSWKDGQRVNRLVLEHGHEVLFGDYKLAFQDVKVAAPPAPPAPPTRGHVATADVPITSDQSLLMPGKAQPNASVNPSGVPAPVLRPGVKAKPPRKGVNPVILVLFLLALLGAVAAVAWKVLSSGSAAPRVVEKSEPAAPEPAPTPAPVDPAPAPAPPGTAETPGATPGTTPAAPPTTPVTPPPAVQTPPTGPGTPVATPPTTPGAKAAPGVTTPRPRRAPPPPPKDNPVVVRYEEGRRALMAGRYADAERAFQSVLQQQPGFRDTEALLAQARQGQVVTREKALAEARAFEASGDWSKAITAYERAGASDQASGARTKMTAAGNDAYRKARQFDARNRPTEAVTWYQRAVEWLPDSDARKATARERLAALRGGAA